MATKIFTRPQNVDALASGELRHEFSSTAALDVHPLFAAHEAGFSTIPLGIPGVLGKKAVIKWRHYTTRMPTFTEIETWLRQFPNNNAAIITGRVSGVVVIDADSPAAVVELERRGMPRTPTAVTGRGQHYYFAYAAGIKNGVDILGSDVYKVDIKTDGGYVVAPHSTHENGKTYSWLVAPDECVFAPLPEWILDLLKLKSPTGTEARQPSPKHSAKSGEAKKLASAPVIAGRGMLFEGERNQGIFNRACPQIYAAKATAGSLDGLRIIASDICQREASWTSPRLSDSEIEQIATSIADWTWRNYAKLSSRPRQWERPETGPMGFERMRGYDYDAYLVEARRRKSEAGKRRAGQKRDDSDARIRSAIAELAWMKIAPTHDAVCLAAGVSRATWWRFRTRFPQK